MKRRAPRSLTSRYVSAFYVRWRPPTIVYSTGIVRLFSAVTLS